MSVKSLTKKIALAAVLALAAVSVGTAPASAAPHVNTTTGMTLEGVPLALRGYDPVAYFTEGRPVLGNPSIVSKHDGAVYQFTSEANRRKFESEPSRFAPQYGGFCAYGVSVGAKFLKNHELFKVVDGKLYLNLNRDIQQTWKKDIAGNISKADGNWREIRDKAPTELK